jgi:phage tail-like protein
VQAREDFSSMTRQPRLIVHLGGEVVQTEDLREPVVSIGRLPENTIVLAGPQVSGRHAQIRREADGIVLIDLDSKTGTFADGVRLLPQQPHALADGAQIQIGLYLLTYRFRDDPEEQARQNTQLLKPEPVRPSEHAAERVAKPPRPTLPPPILDAASPSKYLEQLPIIFHDSDLFRRMLLIYENIWEQLEQRQDFIDMYFDPRTCPASFLRWLASWFDVHIDPHWPEARARALLLEVIPLYRWRGTKYGLTRMLEVCAGVTPEITVSPASPFVLKISVSLPENGSDHIADRDFIEALIREHKPAHVGYVLEVRA